MHGLLRIKDKVINLDNVMAVCLDWVSCCDERYNHAVRFDFLIKGEDELQDGVNVSYPEKMFFFGEEANSIRNYFVKKCPDIMDGDDKWVSEANMLSKEWEDDEEDDEFVAEENEFEDDDDENVEDRNFVTTPSKIRMIQLYQNSDNIEKFEERIKILGESFKTKNMTDTVNEAIRRMVEQESKKKEVN